MTSGREDYIKAIFKLNEQDIDVTNRLLARFLHIAPSSVSEMLHKLEKEGYIYFSDKIVKLSKMGEEVAKDISSKHRLWETFLLKSLNYNWADVHEVAEKLEHLTDERLRDSLNAFLDYPKTCPHGATIYLSNKEVKPDLLTLKSLKVGAKGYIYKVNDFKKLLLYFNKVGLNIGLRFEIVAIDDFAGTYTLSTDNGLITLSPMALKHIFVEKI